MNAPSILLFAAQGYVGGTIASVARADGQSVIGASSQDFPFWDREDTWPDELLRTPADTAILAASFEKPVAHGDQSLEPAFREKFATLLDRLHARRIIFLSSDAVFGGLRGSYLESDARSPATPYGRCKAAMEDIVATHENVCVVRMSVVWGCGSTKPDGRRVRYVIQSNDTWRGAVNAFRSPINVHVLARAIVGLTRMPVSPKILHLATRRMSYLDFLRTCLLPEAADQIVPWVDPSHVCHDTSLRTSYKSLVDYLLV